ncbi:MAG: hypothetical protein K8I04_01235 [Gammaproteobacteria bacterium]|nr:hypothetical protein [Gammaproteobacteria bacterium]
MSIYDPTRRDVLRGLFAAGCALCLQRAVAAETQGGKLDKAQAKYQAQPKGDQRCAACMHFLPESRSCKVVAGDISPDGWCILWAKKPG